MTADPTAAVAAEAPLVARSRPLDAGVDLVAVAGDDGLLFEGPEHGLAGRGVARRVPLPVGAERLVRAADEVAAALGAIVADGGGPGPVAFVAAPFDDASPGSVVIPALVVRRTADGSTWVTTVGPEVSPTPALGFAEPAPDPGPRSFTVTATQSTARWCQAVADGAAAVRAGSLDKLVLAREVVVEADAPLRPSEIMARLRRAYPGCMCFSVEGLVGASPELLVARSGDLVRSHPMAGTAPRGADPSTDARLAASLLASAKDRVEHQVTIDTVLDTLLPFCSYVDAEAEPSVVAMANVQHLASAVRGRLSAPPASALALAAALHPTPAVCGRPRAAALEAIAALEGIDRGRYAGPVGWVDAAGDGAFAVAIRSAEVDGHRARLLAGVGVVADSDPEAELAETRAKFQAVLTAVVQP